MARGGRPRGRLINPVPRPVSLDLFLSSWRDGEPQPVATASFLAPFLPLVARREARCLVLGLPSDQESVLFVDWSAAAVTHAMLSRPIDDAALWQVLHNALRQRGMVMVVPGEVPPLVGTADSAVHLPADMVAALGPPVVVADGLAIRHWIENA